MKKFLSVCCLISIFMFVPVSHAYSPIMINEQYSGENEVLSKPPLQDGNEGGGIYSDYLIYIASREGGTFLDNGLIIQDEVYRLQNQNVLHPQGNPLDFGHSYIVIVNNSNDDLEVGNYIMEPNSTLSLGLWMGILRDYGGIWYNAEQYQIDKANGLHDYVAIKQFIDLDAISMISSYLVDSSNDYYDLLSYNCTHFATNIWNSVAIKKVTNHNGLPSKVVESINSHSLNTVDIPFHNYGEVGYFSDDIFVATTDQ